MRRTIIIRNNFKYILTNHLLFVSWLCFLLLFTACIEKDNTGIACGEPLGTQPSDPIPGETPIVEIVRIQRDANCLSFQCLEHAGLPAYCTRNCNHLDTSNSISCTDPSQCPTSSYCHLGKCVNDDCPAGYWCQEVQREGPLAGQNFCVRRSNCLLNSDCEALGQMNCIQYGCFDQCLLDTSCEFHKLMCAPKTELPCQCRVASVDDSGHCADWDLICQSEGALDPWPQSSVYQAGICTAKQEITTR